MKKIEIITKIYSVTFAELSSDEKEMVRTARYATKNSHSPYSDFKVGCAVKLKQGPIISGANQENAAYPSGLCAERTTIFSVMNDGHKKNIEKIAVTARPGDVENYVGSQPVGPCGACRQVMKEAEDLAGKPITIILDCFNDFKIIRIEGMDSILPLSFGPNDLGITLS